MFHSSDWGCAKDSVHAGVLEAVQSDCTVGARTTEIASKGDLLIEEYVIQPLLGVRLVAQGDDF